MTLRAAESAFSVNVNTTIEADDVVQSLSSTELVEFIKQLDDAAQDWDVTLALCEHFAALKLEHALEEAADAAAKAGGQ